MERAHSQWLLAATLLWLFVLSCAKSAPQSSSAMPSDSLIRRVEQMIEEKKRLEEFRQRYLPRDFWEKIEAYYPVIRKYAKRYGIDWRLIVAQILKESRFKEHARSHKGAIGLMQIMPYTARDITRELDYEYITRDPKENITAGIYYLYKQLQYFPEADFQNRIRLALAAYNAGVGRVLDAQDIARFLGKDPNTWVAVRQCLPLLTSDHWQLHLEVWEQGIPNYGYFYGYEETIDYVDDIYQTYQILKKMFAP